MKKELKEALEELYFVDNLKIPEELSNDIELYEGLKKAITVNAYERNQVARNKCIDYYGLNCTILSNRPDK